MSVETERDELLAELEDTRADAIVADYYTRIRSQVIPHDGTEGAL